MFLHISSVYDSMTDRLLDASRAKALFEDAGISVAEWARTHNFSTGLVYAVLDGQRKCLRGQSHKIAVALGIKKGMVLNMRQISELLITDSATDHTGGHPMK